MRRPRTKHLSLLLLLAAGILLIQLTFAGHSARAQEPGDPTDAGALSPTEQRELVESGKAGRRVVDAIDRGERARAIVWLDAPRTLARSARRDWIRSTRADVEAALRGTRSRVGEALDNIPVLLVEVGPEGIRRLADRPDVARIDLDEPIQAHLPESLPLTRIDQVKALGLDGGGTTIAVIDSGIDGDHPAFAGRIVDEACFCGSIFSTSCCPDGSREQFGAGAAEDDEGHGTAVTGVAAGQASANAPAGVAPGADIIAIKVLGPDNTVQSLFDPLEALDWLIDNHPDVDAINISLGTETLLSGDCDDVLSASRAYADAVEQLRAQGALTFASSGNQGSTRGMAAPACVSSVVAVGSSQDSTSPSSGCGTVSTTQDQISCFGNLSTTTDLVAPGDRILTPTLGDGAPIGRVGTSFASPMSAGCALLLREFSPALSPDAIESALEASPTRLTDARTGRDYPRLDCADALAIVGGPPPTGCASGSSCDDGNPCTADVCNADGTCSNEPGLCVDDSFSIHFGLGEAPFEVVTGGVDLVWTGLIGPTPTDGTGPEGEHTNDPDQFPVYYYVEASNPPFAPEEGNPNKTAILEGPCIDLTRASSASFTFFYHMLGSDQGQLFLEADRGCDGSYEVLFLQDGEATGFETHDYVRHDEDLSSFAGDTVRLRVRGVTGDGPFSDIAVDDFRLQVGAPGSCQTPASCPDEDPDVCTDFAATTQEHIDADRAETQVLFDPSRVEARVIGSDELLESRPFFTSFSTTPRTVRTRLGGGPGFELGACP